jgi:molybdopterin-containing oxidoreductase family membrane subunit
MLSINPFLYNSYILICIVYLWAMLKEKEKFVKVIAVVAVVWAVLVHSGTGAIFGFVPRELYQSALLPPSFISAALSSGTAFMILMILGLFRITKRPLDHELVVRLGRLLAVFIVIVIYFVFVENAYRLYLAESRHAAMHFLFTPVNGTLFWGGMILVGCIIPAAILFCPRMGKSIPWIVLASILQVFGVLCERFLIVIPGQTSPPDLFPGMKITGFVPEAGLADYVLQEGTVIYIASIYEVLQAFSIVALIGFMFVVGLRLFKLLPNEARIHEEPT